MRLFKNKYKRRKNRKHIRMGGLMVLKITAIITVGLVGIGLGALVMFMIMK